LFMLYSRSRVTNTFTLYTNRTRDTKQTSKHILNMIHKDKTGGTDGRATDAEDCAFSCVY